MSFKAGGNQMGEAFYEEARIRFRKMADQA